MDVRSLRGSLSALAFAAALLLFHGFAAAQQKHSLTLATEAKNTRYVQQHAIDVPDVPGHQVRVLEVQRTYPDGPKINGVAIVNGSFWGTSDYVEGKGMAKGYAIWNLSDGNKVFGRWEGVAFSESAAGGARQGEFRGMTWLTGGTGPFKSVRGVLNDTVRFNTDPTTGYSAGGTRGEYWFEP